MPKLKAILLSMQGNVSLRRIAANVGLSDKTVRNYAKKIKADCKSIEELLQMDELELENRFCIGHSAVSDHRFEFLKERLEQLSLEWKDRRRSHVTKELLWEEYCRDCSSCGNSPYGYSQFVFHLNQYLGADADGMRFNLKEDKEPGKYLFVDFTGDIMEYVNPDTGEVTEVQVFVGVYPCTNTLFAMPVPSQSVDDFIHCLDCCVRKMGVPKILVCDNLKAAVVKYDRYDPKLNDAFEGLCAHYGIIPFTARAYRPRDKSEAERYVPVVYNHIFAPLRSMRFFSFRELADAVAEKLRKYVQARPAGSSMTREEMFIAIEKPRCQDLKVGPYEVVRTKRLRVMSDSFIYFVHGKSSRTLYSVPYAHIGKLVTVRYTATEVVVITDREVVARHVRNDDAYRVFDKKHFPSYYGRYVAVSADTYMEAARKTGCDGLVAIVGQLFARASAPELEYKHVDGLLHLCRITDRTLFEKACAIAMEYRTYSYRFMQSLIRSGCAGYDQSLTEISFPSDSHENLRGEEYFAQMLRGDDGDVRQS